MRLHQWICNMLINKMHEFNSVDMIIPVPTHWTRHITRGYCHTYLIARDISAMAQVQYRPDILFKSFMTRSQAGLNKADRSNNLSESFNVCDTTMQSMCGANILLIDDVRTTGATIEECANTLMKCGAENVYGLALAMT
jgi:ComF family protein